MNDDYTKKRLCRECGVVAATIAIKNTTTSVIEQRCASCKALRADQRSYRVEDE
jgi:MinD superfamily P-loop ATPase